MRPYSSQCCVTRSETLHGSWKRTNLPPTAIFWVDQNSSQSDFSAAAADPRWTDAAGEVRTTFKAVGAGTRNYSTAPIVLDSALFMDLAKRAGMSGIQEWLSFYFKAPMHAPEVYPEHDLFIQLMKLKNTLRYLRGEELITHLGREYYD